MMTNLILFAIAATISMVLMTTCWVISNKSQKDREKSSPFECGFDPMSSPRKPFSIQFYLIGILFLIFDVEIAIILPMIILMKMNSMWNWCMIMSMFMTILILGLYHEWYNGALEWMK
uniref:NADH-ubiquinone oxidoreductase chain 3 n=1 Tax=Arbanatus sp. TaxID=2931282 RepID=A0A8T9ZZG4_9HEMI|nr:NADH dehydrogenase subunit 3 [Arbanatus sp.]